MTNKEHSSLFSWPSGRRGNRHQGPAGPGSSTGKGFALPRPIPNRRSPSGSSSTVRSRGFTFGCRHSSSVLPSRLQGGGRESFLLGLCLSCPSRRQPGQGPSVIVRSSSVLPSRPQGGGRESFLFPLSTGRELCSLPDPPSNRRRG